MIKKTIAISVLFATFVIVSASNSKVNAACGAGTNTRVRVRNTNVLIAGQWSSSTNFSGGNGLFGNIGTNGIVSGPSTSTTTQTIVANSNNTNINVTSGGATSTTNVINTGPFVAICN